MRKRLIAGALVVSLVGAIFGLIPGSQASTSTQADCPSDGPLKFQSIAGMFYIDDRQFVQNTSGTQGGIWFYQESNNIPDLQRGGVSLTLSEADNCTDTDANGNPVVPDTLLL